MLLHDARRDARLDEAATSSFSKNRTAAAGITADRRSACRWSRKRSRGAPGPFALQAAIAALHCQAPPEDTDWAEIVRLYDLLERMQPSPVVSLNRAVAVAMVDGPRAGLAADRCAGRRERSRQLSSAACRASRSAAPPRVVDEAAKSYRRALALVTNESERRFLERRLREVQYPPG